LSAYQIYQEAIKKLATDATGHGVLASPHGRAFVDNPLCGDSVEMQVTLADGRITALAHEVRGCLLCRAAASILGKRAPGATPAEIERIGAAVAALLAGDAPPPQWPELDAFVPVRDHRSRHRCVQLPFHALNAALRAAEGSR